ncbi:hypothetical protein GB931_02935 [Modestobacter sp. I12A-02628]|uniref:Uncharacterized protein n=1 Tax=Goekera deserti TaxID=2497753 RepID=A0A7K3WFU4_9ACTN|nr:hypothetical protein [Goekera deserti]MPQ96893.1 hypothetical protein [Goekera deserti]NDI46794.1 hypothetical protein [Goekera deserti]NEL54363.1 hypothetical protein [Goekera deserti]
MAVVDDPDRSRALSLPFGSELALSDEDVRDLFPRAVRPAVFKILWAVLVALLVVLVLLALQYRRLFG